MSITTRPTLYSMLKAEGLELDGYSTDLYVLDTAQAREVIALYESYGGISNKSRFRSERPGDGRMWIELPFHYSPRWVRDSRPTTYAMGRDVQLDNIEEVVDQCWAGISADGRELAVRVVGNRIEVSVAPEGGSRDDALSGFTMALEGGEFYGVEAGDFLHRAGGRTMERILDLAGITRAEIRPAPALKMG